MGLVTQIMALTRLLFIVLLFVSCMGCGQKGPLFLPDEPTQQAQEKK